MITPLNWQEELRQGPKGRRELESFFGQSFPDLPYSAHLPLGLALKIKKRGVDSPLGRQFIPSEGEKSFSGLQDPIGDLDHSPVPRLVHRYKKRALYFPTSYCPVICRYCFRKNQLEGQEGAFDGSKSEARDYIEAHSEINEIILSGGDPLMLTDQTLEKELGWLSEVGHLDYLRLHTRTPISLPSRVGQKLMKTLQACSEKVSRLTLILHVNHASELSGDVIEALQALASLNIEILSQSVLLKGVNDRTEDLEDLFSTLSLHRVTPYYLHHPDLVKGAMGFYLSLEKGKEIVRALSDRLSGWMIPKYVVEIPGGGGKVSAFDVRDNKALDRFGQEREYSSSLFS